MIEAGALEAVVALFPEAIRDCELTSSACRAIANIMIDCSRAGRQRAQEAGVVETVREAMRAWPSDEAVQAAVRHLLIDAPRDIESALSHGGQLQSMAIPWVWPALSMAA